MPSLEQWVSTPLPKRSQYKHTERMNMAKLIATVMYMKHTWILIF
jgi:hypothetical protein